MDDEDSLDKNALVPTDKNRQLSLPPEIARRGLEIAARLEYRQNIQKYQKPIYQFAISNPITCIDFSGNGKYAAIIGNIKGDKSEPEISILEILSGEITPLFGRGHPYYKDYPHSIVGVAISSSGDFALATFDDSGVLCWDVKNLILKDFLGKTSNTYREPAEYIKFSRDEKYFAYIVPSYIVICETQSGDRVQYLHHDSLWFNQMEFSNDGNDIFVACRGGILRYNLINKPKPFAFNHEPLVYDKIKDIRAVAIFPDNEKLLSIASEGTITVWNATSGMEISQWSHNKGTSYVDDRVSVEEAAIAGLVIDTNSPYFQGKLPCLMSRSIAISPDGERILSGGCDKYMRLWDSHGGEICEYPHHTRVIKVAFLPDGQRALSASWDGTISLWELPQKV